jgi:DNA-binding NarL/FixJ family response regulator
MSPSSTVRVLIVDDHAMFRAGVRAELGSSGATAVDVVAEAADVDGALAAIAEHHPDVVLLDVHLPGGGGAEVMRRLPPAAAADGPRFLAL